VAKPLGSDPDGVGLGRVLRLSIKKYLLLGVPSALVFDPERFVRPEVGYVEIFITPNENIGRTDVAVIHVLRVEQIERLKHLDSLPLLENIVYHLFRF